MIMNYTETYKKLLSRATSNYPNKIVVHHSGGTDKYPLADTSHHTAQIIERWHLSKPGWIGIGYHYVIHKDGTVWVGRPEHVHGAHTRAVNATSIGICLAGNFDATLPTEAQTEALRLLMLDIKTRHNITSIKPHRAYANKTCYGNNLTDTWASDLLKTTQVKTVKNATIQELINELLLRIELMKA